ncbi:MAG: hypothetical protein AAFO94_08930, partial [Bacteroidota bacterium]
KEYIKYMELYVNGKQVRRESSYPYEWCKKGRNDDVYLRKLKPGTYRIKVVVYDTCGKKSYKECVIYVDGHNNNPVYCKINAKFRYPVLQKKYYEGQDCYVRLDIDRPDQVRHVELYVNGRFVKKEMNAPYEWARNNGNGDYQLRKLKRGTYKILCKIYDKCGKVHKKECTIVVYRKTS